MIGLLGMVVIFYFQYRHFFKLLSNSHIMASALLAVSSFVLSGFSAYLCKLQKEEIVSIAINSCVRNATLSYAVVINALDVPSNIYAGIPSNAQVLFTTAPIVIAWLVWQAGRKLHTSFQMRRRTTGGVTQRPLVQAFVEQKEEVPMVRVSNIKEAWTNQGSGVSNIYVGISAAQFTRLTSEEKHRKNGSSFNHSLYSKVKNG